MEPIRKLDELLQHVRSSNGRKRIAVAYAQDPNTITALGEAVAMGFVEAIMLGDAAVIRSQTLAEGLDPARFTIVDIPNELESTREAVRMVKTGEADILMKGLVGTDKFLKAVLDKEKGLLPPKAVMSYVCAVEVPNFHKLLFLTDTAVIPFPTFEQKVAMVEYSVAMARKFGIDEPRVALIGSAEKVSPHFPASLMDSQISMMAKRGQIKNCIVDGPLDIFLACDPESVQIKGVPTPIDGNADVLVFPSIETANAFYKGLMLFAGGELAGMIQGTEKPVVVMSRSESAASKLYCLALACLMSEQ